MAHHTLTLNYGPDGFQPDKDPLLVETADTFSFLLGTAPPNSTFKVTMNDPVFFSEAEAKDSNTKITVVEAVSTTYGCHLFDANGNLLTKEGQAGGHVRPGKA
jgi:hypothetical protein